MSSILDRHPKNFDKRIRYGQSPQQFAELRLPKIQGPHPLLFVIHGGFWLNNYNLSHISHLCAALTDQGIVTCSLEYRRLGDPGGGWPGTFQDLVQAIDTVSGMMRSDRRVDTNRTAVIGHSAGGHLALWLASRHRVSRESRLGHGSGEPLAIAISLAGVSNLLEAWKNRLGNGAVEKLIGGSPSQYPDRYREADPFELLPTGTRHVLIHGTADDIVPVSQSENFARRAEMLGDHPRLVKLEGIGHFELIDPESEAWLSVQETVVSTLGLQ